MNPLKRKTMWDEKLGPDSEKNTLILRRHRIVTLSPPGSPSNTTASIEISSPKEDDYGRKLKVSRRYPADKGLVGDFTTGLVDIERAQAQFSPNDGLVQLQSEGSSGLLITYEVPSYSSTMASHYVIGDGEALRFIFKDVADAQALLKKLETVVG